MFQRRSCVLVLNWLSQDQRRLLLSIIPNEKSLSSRSIDDEAGHPDPSGLAHYIKPTLIDALDLEDCPATLEGAISIYGPGSVAASASDLKSSADDEQHVFDLSDVISKFKASNPQ